MAFHYATSLEPLANTILSSSISVSVNAFRHPSKSSLGKRIVKCIVCERCLGCIVLPCRLDSVYLNRYILRALVHTCTASRISISFGPLVPGIAVFVEMPITGRTIARRLLGHSKLKRIQIKVLYGKWFALHQRVKARFSTNGTIWNIPRVVMRGLQVGLYAISIVEMFYTGKLLCSLRSRRWILDLYSQRDCVLRDTRIVVVAILRRWQDDRVRWL